MTARQPRVAAPCGATLGESAVWSGREQALYWVDIRAPALHRLDPATDEHRSWPLPELCGGVAPALSGVLLALRNRLALFDPMTAALDDVLEVEPIALGNRLNEIRCDPSGRVWVGSMRDFAAATTGSLYRVGEGCRLDQILADVTVPNGLGWSPDGRTMYFADTADGAIRAYAFEAARGDLGEMRIVSEPGALPGRPDGCAVDADGDLWSCRVGAGIIMRLSPDGRVGEIVELPTAQPTSCAFGGPDLRTLFVTTARQRLDAGQLRAQPAAGHLFAIDVPVPGKPESEALITTCPAEAPH